MSISSLVHMFSPQIAKFASPTETPDFGGEQSELLYFPMVSFVTQMPARGARHQSQEPYRSFRHDRNHLEGCDASKEEGPEVGPGAGDGRK